MQQPAPAAQTQSDTVALPTEYEDSSQSLVAEHAEPADKSIATDSIDEQAIVEAERRINSESRVKSGANWFYWVAGLSLVNTILTLLNLDWSFVVGLGITQVVDAFTYLMAAELAQFGWILQASGVGLNVVIATMFAACGFFAGKRRRWAFITGIVLYVLDVIILVLFEDWMSVLFHAFVLYGIFAGLRALKQAK